MRLIEGKRFCMLFRMVILMGCLFSSAFADTWLNADASNTNDKLGPFDLGARISYVTPYVWHGVPITQGPCIQPVFWGSLKGFSLGMFINMFGSNKDRKYNEGSQNQDPLTGEGSQSFGMINQVKLYLDWNHTFGDFFSLYTSYTHTAYAEHSERDTLTSKIKTYYEWFSEKSTFGELTIRPSIQIGIFTIFTEQNVGLIFDSNYEVWVPGDTTWWKKAEINDYRSGNYHSTYGITVKKEAADNFTVAATISTDLANKRFLNRFTKGGRENLPLDSWGLYQLTILGQTRYNPVPWFTLAGDYGFEFITNRKIGNNSFGPNTEIKGGFFFGGLHTVFSW